MDYEDEKFDPAHRWEVIATDDVQEPPEAPFYRGFREGDMLQISPSPLCEKCGNNLFKGVSAFFVFNELF